MEHFKTVVGYDLWQGDDGFLYVRVEQVAASNAYEKVVRELLAAVLALDPVEPPA